MSTAQRPTHAYIPGQTDRHPENAFDAIKADVSANMSVKELAQCSAFRHGLLYLKNGYYWEAHEVLEPVWLILPADSKERLFVQGLIQVANAHLKNLMQRPKASLRLCVISKQLLSGARGTVVMGVDADSILAMIIRLEIRL